MSLHDMAIQTSVHQHAPFQIHQGSRFQQAKVGTFECLTHRCRRKGIALFPHHGEANAIVCHTLVDLQLIHEGAFHRNVDIILFMFNGDYFRRFFNDS